MTAAAPTLRELVEAGAGELKWAEGDAREDPRREASLLLQAVVGMDRAQMILRADRTVHPEEAERYWDLVRHRAKGLPLQILVGETPFHDVTLRVDRGVFIPRPETEVLVGIACSEVERVTAVRRASGPVRILDLCTGTGAVAVALAHRYRDRLGTGAPAAADAGAVHVHAADWNPRAVGLARRNAERNDVTIDVRRSDLFSAFADLEGRVDVLTANPPYIAPAERGTLPLEVRLADPDDALFDPDGGTGFHRRIARRGADFLRAGGGLVLEMGETQGSEVRGILEEHGYVEVDVVKDLTGRDRFVRGRKDPSTRSS